LLWGKSGAVVCVCGTVGSLERPQWQLDQHLLDSDHYTKCRDRRRSRPNASHPDPDAYDLWLDAGMQNVAAASELLMPYDARLMRCYPVSTRINHVVNDDEECSAPVEIIQIQNHLFG
jgi:hypothetical protein